MIKILLTVQILILANSLPAIADDTSAGVSIEIDKNSNFFNKLDLMIEQCNESTDGNFIQSVVLELWSMNKLPFGLRRGAEACVNKFLSREAILTWDSGWQFLVGEDDKKVWSTPIKELIEDERASCVKGEGGDFQVPVTAVERIDLTGNGSKDSVVYVGRFRCNGSSSYYTGSGGSIIHLVVGDQIHSYMAHGFSVTFPFGDDYPVIIFGVHGSYCDSYGANNCVMATVWGDGGFQLVSTR